MSLAAGARLGPYEIVVLLGAGGMGEVYKARDTRLGRTVAIKVLPEQLSADADRRRRFEREAKAISALSHSHICTLFDIGSASSPQAVSGEAIFYLVMEHLDGETLAERLGRSALPIRQAVEIGAQIADALDAAHKQGVVHRDLKPGNVMLTPGGGDRHGSPQVKLLDFGLAKLAREQAAGDESVEPTRTVQGALTDHGAAVGTVAYMSPEQATGEEVDHRTDIFSLGVVLYEMVTRHQPFTGATAASTFDAILHKVPTSPVRLNPEVPADLERIIDKALEKDRDLRYQTAADLRSDLNRLRRDSGSGHDTAVAAHAPREVNPLAPTMPGRRWLKWTAAVCAVGTVIAVAAFVMFRRSEPATSMTPVLSNAVKITSAIGVEDRPSWSPDGRAIAYESDQSGNWDIWVTQVGSKQAANRTADSAAADRSPSWSPDGEWIAFYSTRQDGGYFVMPAVGGRARKVASWSARDPYPMAAQWSPDGKQIVVPRDQTIRPWLEVLTLATGASRKLPLPNRPRNNVVLDLSWSPDGRWLAYGRSLSTIAETVELCLTRIADGESFQLTDGAQWDRSPTWLSDSRGLYFVSDRGGTSDLWRFAPGSKGLPEGTLQRLTTGLEILRAASSRNGAMLALVKGRRVSNVFRAPALSDRPATWADVSALTSDEAEYEAIDVSPQERLVVASDRSGNWDVWTLSVNGGELEQLTTDPGVDAGPRWKPDGSEVLFHSSRSGHREVWIQPAGGGAARQVTRGDEESYYPVWSSDGAEVAFRRQRQLFIAPSQGGAERPFMDTAGAFGQADFSPDGKWTVFRSNRDGSYKLYRIPASGGPAERLSERPAGWARWSRDGRSIDFIGREGTIYDIWTLSVSSRQERRLTALSGRRGSLGTNGLAADGRHLYFLWEESRADIWVVDLLQR